MSELVVHKQSVVDLDGFNNFTNEVEGDDNVNTSSRVIQGTKIKFIDPDWLLEGHVITGKLLTVLGERNVVNMWGQDGKPLVTEVGNFIPGASCRVPAQRMAHSTATRSRSNYRVGV